MKECCEDEDGVVDKILPIVEPMMHHRSTRFSPIVGNHRIFMKVGIASFFNSSRLLFNKTLTRDRHAEVKRINCNNKDDQNERTAIVNKNVAIKLTNEQQELLTSSSYPIGYALLGTIKQSMTKPEMLIKKHDLMVENPKERCNYFNIFWKYCVEKKRLLFCSYKPTKRSAPNFCEMLPKVYNNKRSFLIKYLYFEEDILENPDVPFNDEEEILTEPDGAQMNVIRKLVDALTFSYDPMAFIDVQGAKQEAYVRAQALEQPLESVDDFLENKQQIDNVLDGLDLVQKRKLGGNEEKAKSGNSRVKKQVKDADGKKGGKKGA